MSLLKLSTELDHNIIRLLSPAELDKFSQTSKYYRKLTEPYLYEDLQFSNAQGLQIMQLFYTIIRRQGLAQHVRSFTLTDDDISGPMYDPVEDDATKTWQSIDIAKHAVSHITGERDLNLASRWLSAILSGKYSVDGALAVILCLATNMSSLDLSVAYRGQLSLTLDVLHTPWRFKDEGTPETPFSKLRSLTLGANDQRAVPHLPWLTALRSKGRDRSLQNLRPFQYPYHGREIGTVLRTLEMKGVNFDPLWFEIALSEPAFKTIRELHISGVNSGTDAEKQFSYADPAQWGWDAFDFRRMSRALETNLPDLEKLEWSRHDYDVELQRLRPFGSFKGLSKLKSLKVDFDLICDKADTDNEYGLLTVPTESLPASLSELHISGLSPDHFAREYILKAARDLRLSRIELSIIMENWTRDEQDEQDVVRTFELKEINVEYFRSSVCKLATAGVELRVWRQEGCFVERKLFAPHFTQPWPQWSDVDQKDWSDGDLAAWIQKKEDEQRETNKLLDKTREHLEVLKGALRKHQGSDTGIFD